MIKYNLGMPMYWRDETSGRLLASVMAFWSSYADTPKNVSELDETDIANLRMYLVHWAKAPCWKKNPNITPKIKAQLNKAIAMTENIKNRTDINKALDALLDLGIDPF